MRAILIGRHKPEVMKRNDEIIEIVEQKDILWPATADECFDMLPGLESDAANKGVGHIIFQSIPNQLVAALCGYMEAPQNNGTIFGVIINKPGERLAGVEKFIITEDFEAVREAVMFANPRASVFVVDEPDMVRGVRIVVDPPMRFEFSHIEWL